MIFLKQHYNKNQRFIFYIFEVHSKILKYIYLKLKEKFFLVTNSISSHKNLVYNMCLFSSKSCSLFRKYRVSRIFLRNQAYFGFFFGLKKAS
jgi:ribosomal protein S14